MKKFEVLAGLPVYGEFPEQFSATGIGMHMEGLVVQFFPPNNRDSWVGNFQRGVTQLDEALEHPDGSSIVVIAGGEGYVVDIETRKLKDSFGGMIETLISVPEKNIIILGSCIGFEAVGNSGSIWKSRRISWDGIRSLKLSAHTLSGEARSVVQEDVWIPFSLDVNSGEHVGGDKFTDDQ